MDLDIPFSLIFAVGGAIMLYSNLIVLAVVTWKVLIVAIPMVYVAIRLQVINRSILKLYCNREILLRKPSNLSK
jgi:hypothetical protein